MYSLLNNRDMAYNDIVKAVEIDPLQEFQTLRGCRDFDRIVR